MRSGVSQTTVSRIERGQLSTLSLRSLMRVAAAVEVTLDLSARWRGSQGERLVNAAHAALHEAVARRLARYPGWATVPEASFAIYGERGVVDVLAYHAATGSLLVVELKSAFVDVSGLMAAVDRYRRLAPRIAAERGWGVRSVSVWVVVADSSKNRRDLARHATVLRQAFPRDGRTMLSWLRRPIGPVAALSFQQVP